jgi:tetratricopeptide (TPR) repeat protein
MLERLQLIPSPGPTPEPSAQAAARPASSTGVRTPSHEEADEGREVVIDLDSEEEEPVGEERTAQPRPAPSAQETGRTPAPDLLTEIRNALSEGNKLEARRRLDALVLLGYGGAELDGLREEIDAAADEPIVQAPVETAAAAPDEAPTEATAPPATPSAAEEDDDLAAIKEALEGELLDDDDPIIPEEPPDQTMEEVLQEFRTRVEEQVDAGDHRTHYELGIGFKEMGLIDEAIRELQMAVGGADLHREACAMIALCHRDLQKPEEAVKWYCTALEGETAESEAARGLRYDLAEAFLEAGDTRSALDHFRSVLAIDPSFRDVRGRVDELEGQLHS